MKKTLMTSLFINFLIITVNSAVDNNFDQSQNCNRSDSLCYNGPKYDKNKQYKTCSSNGIVLSFDNAPSIYTSKILDVLKENRIKAIFFLKGSNIIQYPDLVQRMINEGHQIGSQTFDLSIITEITSNKFEENIIAFENALSTVNINHNFKKYFRAPRGYLPEDLLPIIEKYNYIPIQWTFRSGDVFAISVDDIINTLKFHLEGTTVNNKKLSLIIQFDSENTITGQYLNQVVNYLNTLCTKGTRFITLNQCVTKKINRRLLVI